jgi:methyl-accepting chemotaxis protein
MKELWNQLPFRVKLLGINFLTLNFLALGIGYSFFQLVGDLKTAKYVDLKAQKLAGASQIAALFFERYGDVQAFASNPVVVTQDYQNMAEYFNRYASIYGIYDHIMYLDIQGRWLAGSTRDSFGRDIKIQSLQKYNYSQEEWFKRALKKEWNKTPSGLEGTVVSAMKYWTYMDQVFSEKLPRQIFATALFDDQGEAQGLIVNIAHPKWITDGLGETMKKNFSYGDKDLISWLIQKDEVILKAWLEKDGTPRFEFPYNKIQDIFQSNLQYLTQESQGPKLLSHSQDHYVITGSPITDSNWSPEIDWQVVYEKKESLFFKETQARTLFGFIVVSLAILLGLVVVNLFSVSFSKSLEKILHDLDSFGRMVEGASSRLFHGSQTLASASTEQAAGVQETMAAIEEISAMVSRNSDSANKSQSQSLEAEKSADRGQDTVHKMLESMQKIKESNEHYSSQLSEANEKLGKIIEAINEIGGKTKVINEIVFQTKLLSFNAAVEAARAGEYGKGFAVVAEEVGNLAQMSGQAAQEISTLLDQSTQQVTQVVEESKNLSIHMVHDIQERVENAEQVASAMAEALTEILENSQKVAGMTAEIATASREQSVGVAEISKAIGEIEVGVQKVNQNANETAGDSGLLSDNVVELTRQIDEIRFFLKGRHNKDQAMSHGTGDHYKRAS